MPKLVDHVSYRKQLLEQCVDLFAQYGYRALTMRQIAEALHVSTGMLYHYFPTKEKLFQDLVEEITQQTIFEATSIVQQTTPEERLLALFRFIEQHEETLQKQFLIQMNYYQHRDLYGETAGIILKGGAVRYGQAVMKLIALPDEQICSMLMSQIHGLLTLRMFYGSKMSFMEQARPFIEILVDYLRKTPGSEEDHTFSVHSSELCNEV